MVERRGEGDCREPWASWEGVSGVVYVGRQESGSLRHAMVGGPVAAAEITAKPQAFGTESVSRGGSFWSPWREGASMVLRVRSVGSVGRLGRGSLELCM